MKTLTFAGLILLAGTHSLLAAKHDPFANWPEGKSSREVDKRVAERFAASSHLLDNDHLSGDLRLGRRTDLRPV
ncbi:MAG TPA: hypothetical protein VEV85_13940, partial [Bryobacteraceae bacterium]|nr:hypothetical protein [Bryobacteraceae bacterium]